MLFRRDARTFPIENCHGGTGTVTCSSLLPKEKAEAGGGLFRFVHDDVLEPGATIAEHLHEGDEELYLVLEGSGTALLDGERRAVGPGDAYLCLDGHTHGIENSADAPMRLLVACAAPRI